MTNVEIIEAAYLAGFEPSIENLDETALYNEAVEYLTIEIRF